MATAAKRGTSVHQCIENYLKFGIEDIPPQHKGYIDAYKKWHGDENPRVTATESRVYHKVLMYAGTVDLLCIADGDALTCIDYKTTSQLVDMLVRVQLEAYARAYSSHGVKISKKSVIHLQKDGTYTAKEYNGTDNEAWETFCGMFTVHNYLKKYGR